MSFDTRITKAFSKALRLPLRDTDRYILMSDCHRGCGTANDNFLKNEPLYLAALSYYFDRNYTYLELGDGDELWENRSMECIREMHVRSFEMLEKYQKAGRMYAIYGNHDQIKKCGKFRKKDPSGASFYEGIILEDKERKKDLYLIHGHQVDILNSTLWRISRFLVRYVWKILESSGIPDPTSAAKNNTKKKKSEEILMEWAKRHQRILISGHTHHPMLGTEDSPYFNTGSCVHPSGITGIEIQNRCMTLVKWGVTARADGTLYAAREKLGETICI